MSSRAALRLATLGLAVGVVSAVGQTTPYKVIGPDGRVTYTDRPPVNAAATRLGALRTTAAAADEVALPLELRQAVGRYPVTLYVTGADCAPCAAARDLLRQRGVPFAERSVQTTEDVQALERLTGGRDTPVLTIGAQVLRGLGPSVWDAYLDAAGYPRESRLPATYRYPLVTPLVPPAPARPEAAPVPDPPPSLPSLPISDAPIRF